MSSLRCGDLSCHASPGVDRFTVRCKKAPALLLNGSSNGGSGGFSSDDFGNKEAKHSLPVAAGAITCQPVPRRHFLVKRNVKDMGSFWDLKLSGPCRSHRSRMDAVSKVQLLDEAKQEKGFKHNLDVCIPKSSTRFLKFDMRGGFAEQLLSIVYAVHIAQRLGFVLALPEFVERKQKRILFSSLFDVPVLQKSLAATANVQSQHGNPERPGLQYTRIDVASHTDYVEYMGKIGGLAMSGGNLVVDVGDLFLRLTVPSCGIQDELASILKAISSCFRKEVVTSANVIVDKLTHSMAPMRWSKSFNAVDLSSSSGKSSLAFSETWEERLKESGFSKSVPVYAACGDSCAPLSKATNYTVYQSRSFSDLLPRLQHDSKHVLAAAVDFLVLAKSYKFAGSMLSVFSHLVVTTKNARDSYAIHANFTERFEDAKGGVQFFAYGGVSPRQPCLGSMDEDVISRTADAHPRDVLRRRRAHLKNHGVEPSSLTDALVSLELFRDGKLSHARKILQVAAGLQTSDSPQLEARETCAFIEKYPLSGYALQRYLQISCPSIPILRPANVLFVSHNLRLEGAPLVMKFLIEYFVKVLHLQVDVLASVASCKEALRATLLDLGVRRVLCQPNLDPRGYDAIYLNTIVSWYELPNPLPAGNSWLNRTIWWVHESLREMFPLFPNTPELLPLARSRIFVSNATRSVYADLGKSQDWTIYNALDTEDHFLKTAATSLREHTRSTLLGASPEETVFVLAGSVRPERHQLEFVNAANKMMKDDPASLCRFVLVGFTGENVDVEKAVRDAVAESSSPEKFSLLDKKEHEVAVQIISAADVLVSVSDKESFGMALLEGMTSGLPVIVQKVDGVPEVVYESAIDIDPRDIDSFASALHRMQHHPTRSSHAALAAARSAFFDKGIFYTKHVLALRELLESSSQHD